MDRGFGLLYLNKNHILPFVDNSSVATRVLKKSDLMAIILSYCQAANGDDTARAMSQEPGKNND